MMTTIDQIKWGKYSVFEGPFYPGRRKFKLSSEPTENEKRLCVVTSTEGGSFDAVNCYDSCIVSTGLIQLCEARYFLTSKLLHHIASTLGPSVILNALSPAFQKTNSTFAKNKSGQWRFHLVNKDATITEITTTKQQQALFLGCNGKQGSWTPEAKERAKLWAACFANIWESEAACFAQVQYLAGKLTSYVVKDARNVLWDNTSDEGWAGATRAVYLSFSTNIPAIAAANLKSFLEETDLKKWTPDWCIGLIKKLTFGKEISIYPHRYNSLRPWVEKLWNVKLPTTYVELSAWKPPVREDALSVPDELTPTSIVISSPISSYERTTTPDVEPDFEKQSVVLRNDEQEIMSKSNLPEWLIWIFKVIKFVFSWFTRRR